MCWNTSSGSSFLPILRINWRSVDKDFSIGRYAYDIEVEVNDNMRYKLNNFVGGNPALNKEIMSIDEKVL